MESSVEFAPTKAEIAGRLAAVAARAADQGMQALVVLEPANIYYLSGFRTTLYTRFMAVALRTDAPAAAMLIATSVDRPLALEPFWFPSLLDRTEIYYLGAPEGGTLVNNPGPLLDQIVHDGDVVGIDLAGASYGHVQLLLARHPMLHLRDATNVLHAVRRVKSAGELAALRAANALAVRAMARVPALLHTGLSEIELAAALDGTAREGGADGFAYPTLIGFGPKSLAPHAPPTKRRLERDAMVTIAFGPTVAGYCADLVRTFFHGIPPPVAVQSGERCVEVQAAALKAVRAGARAGDLMRAARAVITRYDPDAPASGSAGHSLGLTIHETPTLTADNDLRLEAGMVLAIEPRQPAAAMDGVGLYRHCDVVQVTTDGYDLLTPLDRGLVVAPISSGSV